MRAPSSSSSGWHETSGRAIVKRMSAKSPRARRSRMWRSVSVVRLGGRGADDVEAQLLGEASQFDGGESGHARILPG